MSDSSSIAFFDSLAQRWDSFHDLRSLDSQLDSGLDEIGVQPDEHILDVGCGTGNLTAAIVRRLSPRGRVTAIDLSAVMLDRARAKVTDARVSWVCGAVEDLECDAQIFDRIICYSVWPHLTDAQRVGSLLRTWLKPGGRLHIWHTISRAAVNKIHSQASAAVSNHLLAPAHETASLLDGLGYAVEDTRDDEAGYLVTARKIQL